MILRVYQWFKKEKFYGVLFLIILAVYSYVAFGTHRNLRKAESPAVHQYEQAEQQFQQKLRADRQSFKTFVESHPDLAVAVEAFTVFFFLLFLLGLVLEFLLIFVPSFRKQVTEPQPFESTIWKFGMLFKAVMLFLTFNLLLTICFAVLKKYFFPQITENFYLLSHTVLTDSVCLLIIAFMVRQEGGGHWRDLGWRLPSGSFFRECWMGWAGYAAILPLFILGLILVLAVSSWLNYEPESHPLVSIFLEEQKSIPMISYSLLIAALAGPVIEELFFRGFCYRIFKEKYGIKIGMFLSAFLFALIHANTFAFWPIFILGLGLVYLYEIRKSIVAPVVLHITHNAIFIAYFFLMKTIVSSYSTH